MRDGHAPRRPSLARVVRHLSRDAVPDFRHEWDEDVEARVTIASWVLGRCEVTARALGYRRLLAPESVYDLSFFEPSETGLGFRQVSVTARDTGYEVSTLNVDSEADGEGSHGMEMNDSTLLSEEAVMTYVTSWLNPL